MASPGIIDLHTHPDIKSFLTANKEKDRHDCWEALEETTVIHVADRLAGNILTSQANFDQLADYKGSVAVVGMYAFEKAMLSAKIPLLKKNSTNLFSIAKILEKRGINDKLSSKLIKRITSPKTKYYNIFREELKHLMNSKSINGGFKILDKFSDYDPAKLNIILSIEGGHNICNKGFRENKTKTVLKNLKKIRKKNRYLFLTPAHVENNDLCNHAYSMKFFVDDRFYPAGCGLTPLGKKVIKHSLKGKKPILIDIKHMSLKARREYYKIHRKKYKKVPIISSHSGITGVSYKNMPIKYCKSKGEQVEVQYFQPDGVSETKFNPWSINLYDEDIKEILDSDGIIGLILDERVLGTKQKKEKDLVEYFSKEEFCNPKFRNCVFRHNGDSKEEEELSDYEKEMHKLEDELREHLESIVKDKSTDLGQLFKKDRLTRKLERIKRRSMRKRKHILKKDFDIQHLCNNILHIVHVGGDKAWKHICLGTDFDGLINPIEGCNYASNFDDLRKELKIYLPKMALEYPLNLRITGIDKKVDDFMYWNAWRFLQKNFN